MFFQQGIEKEAEIYLNASIIGLQARQSYVDSFVAGTSANLKQMNIYLYSYVEVVEAIVGWSEQDVRDNGQSVCDEDGVAWFIGLYCKAYIASIPFADTDYNTLFKDCFIKYFENK